LSSLNTDMPNVRRVSVPEGLTFEQRVEAAAAVCEGEYVVAVPSGVMPGLMWVEKFLWPLMNSEGQRVAFELDGSTENACCAVMRLEHLREALGTHKEMMLHHRLRAAGVVMRKPEDNELPFRFDEAYERGCLAETRGEWPDAARFYQYAASRHGNQLWMDSLTAEALRKAGRLAAALEYSSRVNGQRPTVDSLYTEAMARKASGDAGAATELLENARDILEGKHTVWA
ncbi:MAG TPA: hypothetical protein VLH60_00255, partial [Sedimentisphaerales bacterium]|nr:hypothetical protein [Sedimentisphaerales bacterium]